jgi:hypothetical protein
VKCRDTIFCAREGLGQIRQKNVVTRYTEIAFLCPVGFVGHVVHSIASGPQNIDAVFLCSVGPGTDFTKCVSGHVTWN